MMYISKDKIEKSLFLVAFVALYLLVPIIAVWEREISGALRFFAADTFYYLTIANNSDSALFATFNQEGPTNGFHPLWQFLLIYIFRFIPASTEWQIWITFILSHFVTVGALLILANIVYEETRSYLAPLFLIPGLYFLFSSETGLYSIVTWRIANGMETPFSLLMLALIVKIAHSETSKQVTPWSDRSLVLIGICAGLSVLARLDNVALILFLPLYLLGNQPSFRRVSFLVAPSIFFFFGNALIGIVNGLPAMPASGAVKSGFVLFQNLETIFHLIYFPGVYSDLFETRPGWVLRAKWSIAFFVTFFVFLSYYLIMAKRSKFVISRFTDDKLFVFLPLLLLLFTRLSYYLTFVIWSHQGFWYYGEIAIFLTTVLLVSVFSKFSARKSIIGKPIMFSAWLLAYAFSSYGVSVASKGNNDCPNVALSHVDELRQCILSNSPNGQFIDLSDGIFSYFTGLPSEPGVGLTPDPKGYSVLKKSGKSDFHRWAIEKGFSVAVFSERCNSGRINRAFVLKELECSPHRSIKIFSLQVP